MMAHITIATHPYCRCSVKTDALMLNVGKCALRWMRNAQSVDILDWNTTPCSCAQLMRDRRFSMNVLLASRLIFLCTSYYMTCHHFHTALQCLLLALQEQILSEHLISLLRAMNASSVVSRRTRRQPSEETAWGQHRGSRAHSFCTEDVLDRSQSHILVWC